MNRSATVLDIARAASPKWVKSQASAAVCRMHTLCVLLSLYVRGERKRKQDREQMIRQ